MRFRDDSGWTAWVADDESAELDPERFTETEAGTLPAAKAGWHPDPGAFRWRWWDGEKWTSRVVGTGVRIRYSEPDTAWPAPYSGGHIGKPRTPHARRRKALLLISAVSTGVALLVLVAIGALVFAADYSPVDPESIRRMENSFSRWHEERAEMNGWDLPQTVVRASRRDDLGGPPDSTSRMFLPQLGVDPQRAAEDLVASLRTQGYGDLQSMGVAQWTGSCFATRTCRMQIKVEHAEAHIIVTLSA